MEELLTWKRKNMFCVEEREISSIEIYSHLLKFLKKELT